MVSKFDDVDCVILLSLCSCHFEDLLASSQCDTGTENTLTCVGST